MIQISEWSKDDYVALGRFFLGTGPIPGCLASAFPKSLGDLERHIDKLQGNLVTGGLMALIGFALYLRFRRDLQAQKAPFTSTDAESFLRGESKILSGVLQLLLPRLSTQSASEVASLFRDLATGIEIAEAFPEVDDQEAMWAWLQRVGKTYPSLAIVPKGQKRTQRIHRLLWLFDSGFGRLTEVERYEVLERIGLSAGEIPSGDALRKMLSSRRLALRRIIQEVEPKSPKKEGTRNSAFSGQSAASD